MHVLRDDEKIQDFSHRQIVKLKAIINKNWSYYNGTSLMSLEMFKFIISA